MHGIQWMFDLVVSFSRIMHHSYDESYICTNTVCVQSQVPHFNNLLGLIINVYIFCKQEVDMVSMLYLVCGPSCKYIMTPTQGFPYFVEDCDI